MLAGDEGAVACSGLERGPSHTVARVIDGETVVLDDGRQVRLLGALAPRAMDAGAEPGAWPLETAATAELTAFALGKTIELAFAAERLDRYGRLQAHGYARESGQLRWLQGHLLTQGLARAFVQAGSRLCPEALLAAEQAAREARRGLWAEAAYHVRRAARPAELARYRSTFQVVEGRIVRVAQVRGTIYLNFSRDWRRGFSVSLRRGDRELLGAYGGDPQALAGRHVRVRGWLEQRRAPAIDLSAAGLLEVLDEPPSTPEGRRDTRMPASPSQEPQAKPPGLIEAGRSF